MTAVEIMSMGAESLDKRKSVGDAAEVGAWRR